MKGESKSEDGYMRIHDVCLMADGSKVLVGEFYRRTVSAMGVASKVLGGGGAVAQISLGDMFLLRIDKNNNPTMLEKIEKGTERIPLPTDGLSLGLIQRWLGQEGFFGYLYTDEDASSGRKTVLVKGALEGEKYGRSAITFDEKKGYKIKKFDNAKEKHETIYLRRAKPGFILVMKYNSKKKTVSLNLEKVD